MLKPVEMRFFSAVIFDSELNNVVSEVVRCGVLHLVKVDELNDYAGVRPSDMSKGEAQDCINSQNSIDSVLKTMGISRENISHESCDFSLDEIKNDLTVIEETIDLQLKERDNLRLQLEERKVIRKQVGVCGPIGVGKAVHGDYRFLETAAGSIPLEKFSILKESLCHLPVTVIPFMNGDKRVSILVMSLKRDHIIIRKILEGAAFLPFALCIESAVDFEQAIAAIDDEIKSIEANILLVNNQLNLLSQSVGPVLAGFWDNLAVKNTIFSAREYFKRTGRTYCIFGWLPLKQCRKLAECVRAVSLSPCYIDFDDPKNVLTGAQGKIKVPVMLDNAAIIRPFETVLKNYGLPEYGEIDPTLFVAISFILMFGAMFGDLGQGFIFCILGVVLMRNKKEGLRAPGVIFSMCGISSMVFGILYGSVFGMENIIPALWMRPMENISSFLSVTIIFGVVLISLGIILNLVNAVRARDMVKLLFGKSGLLGGLIYWVIVVTAAGHISGRLRFDLNIIFILLAVLSAGLFLRAFVECRQHNNDKLFPDGLFSYVIEIAIEFIEIFGGLLSNTVSFVRIGAFALAHMGLSIAIFALADILRNSATGPLSAVIMVISGNIAVMILEGMVVMIQSLRLEYYEFFSKFFSGEGVIYKPIKLV